MKTLTTEIDISGAIAMDQFTRENDYAERVEVSYVVNGRHVTVQGARWNDARYGKPPNWVACPLPIFVIAQIEKMLEAEIEEERQLGAVA